eukprot:365425-Chlamydomonas_euryale.AAC.13
MRAEETNTAGKGRPDISCTFMSSRPEQRRVSPEWCGLRSAGMICRSRMFLTVPLKNHAILHRGAMNCGEQKIVKVAETGERVRDALRWRFEL